MPPVTDSHQMDGTMRRWPSLVTVGFGMALALTAFVRAQAPRQAPAPGSTTPDADKLFAKIYPVFASPRCANCHGVVQHYPGITRSVTGATHPGGEVLVDPEKPRGVDCGDCHNATDAIREAWQFTAPDQMEWAGKTEEQVCAIEADQVQLKNGAAGGWEASRPGSYLNHLSTDPLVAQAFLGRAGGARDEDIKEDLPHPPLAFTPFIAGATEWVKAGAPCKTTGTISQVEVFKAAYAAPFAGGSGRQRVLEYARREVDVLRMPDGTTVADISMSGSQTISLTTQADGCTITATSQHDWTRTGPARVTTDVEVKVLDGRYEIHFSMPQDIVRETSSSRTDNTCGARNIVDPPESVDTKWVPWAFTIRCPTELQPSEGRMHCDPLEPRQQRSANGSLQRTVLGASDAAERQSRLNGSPAGTARMDTGKPLPVTVTTRWHIPLGATGGGRR